MEEQLKQARRLGWCYSGVVPHGPDAWAQTDSVNERRCVEALRFAVDLLAMAVKPSPIEWFDSQGIKRTYHPDARVERLDREKILVEMKPRGILRRNQPLSAKYEEIGRFLQHKGEFRFALMEWQWDSVFARNISLLSRYWNVDPATHAVDAFNAIGDHEVSLAQLFEHVDRSNWPAVWAAVAHQYLTADLHVDLLTRDSCVSMPGAIYQPVRLDDLVTMWWA